MAPASVDHDQKAEELRKATTFHPSLWGDFFLTYQPPTAPQHEYMKERAVVLREDVRKIVNGSTDLRETMDLIITLQRLGLDYYYENEIDKLLQDIHNLDYNDKDLNLVSLRFYLLRKNNYDVSSDVFLNFKIQDGNFAIADTRSLLSLYNAAYLRRHGDKVLDEAISFTRCCLQDIVEHSESPFAKEVSSSLHTPLFRRVGILEARNYIPIYEKEATRNEAILEYAKLNFYLQQLVFCEELKHCTMWWKEFLVKSKMTFVRDRIVEVYFWMNGACYDPPYSHSRIILTKITSLVTILDDMFDTYGTTEECIKFAEAINRWNESAVPLLPEYMKGFYLFLLETFYSFEDELGPEKSYRVLYLKEAREQTADHSASTVHCYMKEHGTTMNDACEKIKELTEDLWKDMLEQCLALKGLPKVVPRTVFDFSRTTDNMYKNCDAFTSSQALKQMIELLFVEPIPE
ncbi:hypothetical protein PVAP13_6NG192300 [Panicum virgatum]|uniref:Uncharacterized protein n=1 Tax=Panicum virgatum TaxID=38727 RepID=A0A8T0QWG9_PANVG|nr:hypothetical protein PVAP13_6NG192300 [Panicum virgatum]